MPYRNDKNIQDRLKAQKRYYERNREVILKQRKLKRRKHRKITRGQQVLLDLYNSLKEFLQMDGLIDWVFFIFFFVFWIHNQALLLLFLGLSVYLVLFAFDLLEVVEIFTKYIWILGSEKKCNCLILHIV